MIFASTQITGLAEVGVPRANAHGNRQGHISREMPEHYGDFRVKAKRAAVAAIESYNPEKPN
jgi:hypothetical protein